MEKKRESGDVGGECLFLVTLAVTTDRRSFLRRAAEKGSTSAPLCWVLGGEEWGGNGVERGVRRGRGRRGLL
jgi:hypothetical protein